MKKDYRTEVISTIISVLLAIGFEVIPGNKFKEAITFTFISTIFFLIIVRLPILPILDKSSEDIEKKLSKFSEDLKDLISDHKVSTITHHISSLNPISKEVGRDVFRNYMGRFNLKEKGFFVKGEQFALNSYVLFWEKLTAEQRKRKLENNQNLIARITHSNQIEIWCDNSESEPYSSLTDSLYTVQREFIKSGGVIVRILIGDEMQPNEKYLKSIAKMKKIGIEVKYLPRVSFSVQDYDFLFLYDEQLVLKWYADSNGIKLSGFAIEDHIEDEVIRDWKKLYNILEEQGTPIETIPKNREFF